MRTHVEFRSAKFPAYPREEEQVNPDLWGKKLAEYPFEKVTFFTGTLDRRSNVLLSYGNDQFLTH